MLISLIFGIAFFVFLLWEIIFNNGLIILIIFRKFSWLSYLSCLRWRWKWIIIHFLMSSFFIWSYYFLGCVISLLNIFFSLFEISHRIKIPIIFQFFIKLPCFPIILKNFTFMILHLRNVLPIICWFYLWNNSVHGCIFPYQFMT